MVTQPGQSVINILSTVLGGLTGTLREQLVDLLERSSLGPVLLLWLSHPVQNVIHILGLLLGCASIWHGHISNLLERIRCVLDVVHSVVA